jgi:hypothetical protein
MNHPSTDPRHPWARLVQAARKHRDDRDASAPLGFATRVVALALAQERSLASLFDRFALRALGVACLLALGSLALNYRELSRAVAAPALTTPSLEVDLLANSDVVAVVLDLED